MSQTKSTVLSRIFCFFRQFDVYFSLLCKLFTAKSLPSLICGRFFSDSRRRFTDLGKKRRITALFSIQFGTETCSQDFGTGSQRQISSSGLTLPLRAILITSLTSETGIIFMPVLTFSGISSRSFSFSFGIITVLMPPQQRRKQLFLQAARIGSTLPCNVISPVIATSFLTGILVSTETSVVYMAIPADGPSFGVAPSGT